MFGVELEFYANIDLAFGDEVKQAVLTTITNVVYSSEYSVELIDQLVSYLLNIKWRVYTPQTGLTKTHHGKTFLPLESVDDQNTDYASLLLQGGHY